MQNSQTIFFYEMFVYRKIRRNLSRFYQWSTVDVRYLEHTRVQRFCSKWLMFEITEGTKIAQIG